jgi:hypothetical protein
LIRLNRPLRPGPMCSLCWMYLDDQYRSKGVESL